MDSNEGINQKFFETYKVVEQRIKASPFCIVAIGGVMGSGKSELLRYLSWMLRLPQLEMDLFLRLIESKVRYDYKYIHEILEFRKITNGCIIVGGCSILPVLSKFDPSEIFLIHIENKIPSDHSSVELNDWGNTEHCLINEIPDVDLKPDFPSELKAKANYTISW